MTTFQKGRIHTYGQWDDFGVGGAPRRVSLTCPACRSAIPVTLDPATFDFNAEGTVATAKGNVTCVGADCVWNEDASTVIEGL